jgi:hypothetical protein
VRKFSATFQSVSRNVHKLKTLLGEKLLLNFIRTLDRIFDFLNSRNPRGKSYKRPIRLNEVPYYERKINEWTLYLYSLTTTEGSPLHLSKRRTFIFGIATSLKSVLAVCRRLLQTPLYR